MSEKENRIGPRHLEICRCGHAGIHHHSGQILHSHEYQCRSKGCPCERFTWDARVTLKKFKTSDMASKEDRMCEAACCAG